MACVPASSRAVSNGGPHLFVSQDRPRSRGHSPRRTIKRKHVGICGCAGRIRLAVIRFATYLMKIRNGSTASIAFVRESRSRRFGLWERGSINRKGEPNEARHKTLAGDSAALPVAGRLRLVPDPIRPANPPDVGLYGQRGGLAVGSLSKGE